MGEIAFYGLPNADHEVELGYGLSPQFQEMGYMTEAVKTLSKWALLQENVNIRRTQFARQDASKKVIGRSGDQGSRSSGQA